MDMNVDKRFKTLTEADCRKRFPKGYFAAAEKTSKGAGIVLMVIGVLFAPVGFWLLFLMGKSLVTEGFEQFGADDRRRYSGGAVPLPDSVSYVSVWSFLPVARNQKIQVQR